MAGISFATVSTTTPRSSLYATNGSATEFTFSFPIINTSDLVVILRTDSTGAETVLTETTDYSVSATNNDYSSGGTVTTVSTYDSGYSILILRNTPDTQETDLEDSGVLRLETLEGALDKLTMLVQQLQEESDRSIKFPRSDSASLTSEIDDSVNRASKNLTFDSNGNVTASDLVSGSTSFTSFGTDLVGVADAETAQNDVLYGMYVFNVKSYGAAGDDATDDTTAIQAAIDAAELVNGKVYIPNGTYKFTTGLTVDSAITIEGEDERGAILKKYGNIAGITTTIGCTMTDFTLDSDGGADAAAGISVTSATYRTRMKNVTVTNQGSIGIEILSSNLGTYEDLTLLSNGSDGMKVNGTHDNPDTNGIVFKNLDCRGNTGWGFNLEDGRSNFGMGIAAQSNVGGGIRVNDRSNFLQIYTENNIAAGATDEIELTSETNCRGNMLAVALGAVTDNSSNINSVLHAKRSSVFDFNYNRLTADKFLLQNIDQAANSVTGIFQVDHSNGDGTPLGDNMSINVSGTSAAAVTLNLNNQTAGKRFDLTVSDGVITSGANSTDQGVLTLWDGTGGTTPGYIKIASPGGTVHYLFVDDDGGLKTHTAVPTANTSGKVVGWDGFVTLADDATPTVAGVKYCLTGGTTTITDLDDGVTGQVVTIMADHSVTITDGTNLYLNSSGNFVMGASDTLTLICRADNKWYEIARSNN